MRILMVSDTYLPQINGVATSIYLSKKYLEMRGHRVYIVAPVKPDDDPDVLTVPGITFPFEKQHKVVFANHLKILEFAQEKGIELIHSHDPLALGIRALKVQREMRLPHVHTYHTLLTEYRHYVPPPFTPDRKTVEEFSKWFCNKVNVVIAPTPEIKTELQRYGVERPIEVIPTGIDTTEFSKPATRDVRGEYGIPKDAILLMYAGRLAKEKNLDFLCNVVARVMREEQRVWFMLVGDGPERKSLEEFFERTGLEERVVFTGYVPHKEIADFYKASDLFVFASLTETQGLVVLEALASGTPVVAIAYKGVANVLRNGEGALTTGVNEEEFYHAIFQALSKRDELSEKGKLYVEKHWSMNAMVERLEAVYMEAMEQGFVDFEMPSVISTSLQLKLTKLFKKFLALGEEF
ncbi:glycosyltransferase family 4 protein [Fervidobacterium thailandense]|uniref:Glycosyl transferase family 1 n=1 Tax=Fervidobacterium thailandense TaxID=1008305 RepID=A0A1E3G654_9BACT|nr:glycosyltransferase family 4 protein [Fervidobacterium thailandense]ODN31098.1 glycosyl transferase family 1 [Fervidobacterium thailandense]